MKPSGCGQSGEEKNQTKCLNLCRPEGKGLVRLLTCFVGPVTICSRFRCASELRLSAASVPSANLPPPRGAKTAPFIHNTSIQETRRDGGDERKSREGCASAASSSSPHAFVVICPLVVHIRYKHFRPLSGLTEGFYKNPSVFRGWTAGDWSLVFTTFVLGETE